MTSPARFIMSMMRVPEFRCATTSPLRRALRPLRGDDGGSPDRPTWQGTAPYLGAASALGRARMVRHPHRPGHLGHDCGGRPGAGRSMTPAGCRGCPAALIMAYRATDGVPADVRGASSGVAFELPRSSPGPVHAESARCGSALRRQGCVKIV